MKHPKLQADLTSALARRCLVRLHRKFESGAVDGRVVALGDRWLLLLLVDPGIAYAGFQACRLQDVATWEVPSPRAAFFEAVLRRRSPRRPRAPRIDLTSTQALVQTAGRRFPLITVHRENAAPTVCHIGKLVSTTASAVTLRLVTPDATWTDAPSAFRLSQITRVDFGGPYEEALAWMACPNSTAVSARSG